MTNLEKIRGAVVKDKNHHNYKHGLSGSGLYQKWEGIRRRCRNANDPAYRNYGGRGIGISKSWEKFENFARDMGPTFKLGLSLDRIDNSKGYSKYNCRWVPMSEQSKNRRNVKKYRHQGKSLTIREWSEESGINHNSLYARLARFGWPIKLALSVPVSLGNKYRLHRALPHGKVK